MELIKCIICNSNHNHHFISLNDRLTLNSETFNLVQCECGFVFLNPRPTELQISKYYKSLNYDPHNDRGDFLSTIYKIVQQIMFYWKYQIIIKYSKFGTMLDIGGGKGEFASFMNKKKWNVSVYDKFIDLNIKETHFKKINNLDSIKKNKCFDFITMWHSLEHIHDVKHIFLNLQRLLKEDGTLLIAVPNIDALERNYYDKDWAPYDAPRHLYHFNLASLEKLCINNNFKIIKKYSLFQDTPYNILLSIKKLNFKSTLKAVYVYFFSFFYNILKGPTHSSSFIIICQKS